LFPADAAEFRIVANQVCELSALLDQIAPGEAIDLLLKSGDADQFAEDLAGVVEGSAGRLP
jgi:hypothetical protein